jgi:hypothetical protein
MLHADETTGHAADGPAWVQVARRTRRESACPDPVPLLPP